MLSFSNKKTSNDKINLDGKYFLSVFSYFFYLLFKIVLSFNSFSIVFLFLGSLNLFLEMQFENSNIDIDYLNFKTRRHYKYKSVPSAPHELLIGVSSNHKSFFIDMNKSPHLLIGGSTGSGKSTVLHTILNNLILNYNSDFVLHLVDFKSGVEFSYYDRLPFVSNFVSDIDDFLPFINSILEKVNSRYDSFRKNKCRNIIEYNNKFNDVLEYEYIFIDEFSDLSKNKLCMSTLCTILKKSRACGIFFILATQRPDSDVVPGYLKINLNNSFGLKTLDSTNSRVLVDVVGCEKLRGFGHGLLSTLDGVFEIQGYNISSDTIFKNVRSFNSVRPSVFAEFNKI